MSNHYRVRHLYFGANSEIESFIVINIHESYSKINYFPKQMFFSYSITLDYEKE